MEFVFGAFGLPCSNLVKPITSIFSWIKFPPKNKYPSDRAPHVKTKHIVQDKREHTLPKPEICVHDLNTDNRLLWGERVGQHHLREFKPYR